MELISSSWKLQADEAECSHVAAAHSGEKKSCFKIQSRWKDWWPLVNVNPPARASVTAKGLLTWFVHCCNKSLLFTGLLQWLFSRLINFHVKSKNLPSSCCRCSRMSWKAWSRTSWPRATTPQVSWRWGRLLTWSWRASWEEPVPWLHPSVSVCLFVCVCLSVFLVPLLFSALSVQVLYASWISSLSDAELSNSCDTEQPRKCRKGRK